MKTKLFNSVLMVVVLLTYLPTSAYDFMDNGLCYKINQNGVSVSVTYETYNSSSPSYSNLSGNISIPDKVTHNGITYPVTEIGYYAFRGCSDVTGVSIPGTITAIRGYAFMSTGLTDVAIPNSVTFIGDNLFSGCTNLKSAILPNSITCINSNSFFGCNSLMDIEIPHSVTMIEELAFAHCTSLTSMTIPSSVTSIGNNAFFFCNSLTSVTTPDLAKWSEIYFRDQTANPLFYAHHLYCNGAEVQDLDIPEGTTRINAFAFAGGTNLTTLTIPTSVTAVGQQSFLGCKSLNKIYCKRPRPVSASDDAFEGVDTGTCILYVPKESEQMWWVANVWKDFVYIEAWDNGNDPNPTLRGDVNGDGIVNGADVTALYEILLEQ